MSMCTYHLKSPDFDPSLADFFLFPGLLLVELSELADSRGDIKKMWILNYIIERGLFILTVRSVFCDTI